MEGHKHRWMLIDCVGRSMLERNLGAMVGQGRGL